MLRYPGGKDKLKGYLIDPISCFFKNQKNSLDYEYREPFFGGGAIGLDLLKKDLFKNIWINDKDYSLSCLWSSVINNPNDLIDKIYDYTPSPENFNKTKKYLIQENFENESSVSIGAKKLIVHKTSFSGLGTMSGPLGGNEQKGKYKNDARWNLKSLTESILSLNSYFKTKNIRNNSCTNLDCMEVLSHSGNWFAYLDPPYYEMGDILYPVKFSPKQHQDLSEFLKKSDQYWILSYDNSPEIKRLYSWANIKEVEVNYSITEYKKKTELLIYPNNTQFIFDLSEKFKTREIF